MKQKNLSTYGYILVEATVGVVLFSLLMIVVLQSMGFITQQIALVAHRHKALNELIFCAQQESTGEIISPTIPSYTHSLVVWYKKCIQSGNQFTTLYAARQLE